MAEEVNHAPFWSVVTQQEDTDEDIPTERGCDR